MWILRLDSAGSVLWQQTYGGTSNENLDSLELTSDGGYIVAGSSESYGGGNQMLVLRLSPTGEIDPSCGGLSANASLPAADWGVSDDTTVNFAAATSVTAATPVYVTNSTNGTNTTLCTSSCQVSCMVTAPASSLVGSPASFTSLATLVDCGGRAVSYSWAFGDGLTSFEQNPSYAYAIPGVYTWTLTVTAPGASPCVQSGSITVSSVSAAVPDLTGAWTSVKKKKSKLKVTFTSQNIDFGDAGGFTIKLYTSKKPTISKKSKLIKTETVPSLASGGTASVPFKTTLQNRHKYLIALVDADGTVAESNEGNNTVVQAIP